MIFTLFLASNLRLVSLHHSIFTLPSRFFFVFYAVWRQPINVFTISLYQSLQEAFRFMMVLLKFEIFMYKIIIMMFKNELSELTLAWCFQLHEFWRMEVGCQGGTSSMRGTLIFNRIANLFIWIWSITRNWSSRSFKFSSLSFCNCRSKFSISLSVKDMLIVHQRHEHRTQTTTLRHSWATAVKEAPNSVPPTSQLSREFAVMP